MLLLGAVLLNGNGQTVSYDPIQVRVSPRVAYIRTNEFLNPPPGKTNILNLAAVDLIRGDKVQLRTTGSFAINTGQAPDGTVLFGPEEPRSMLGVFALFTAFRQTRQVANPLQTDLPGFITPPRDGALPARPHGYR